MAGRWRVLVEELQDLSNPHYRVGDHLRQLKASLTSEDDVIKGVVVEVGFEDEFQSTKPFGIPADGNVKLGEVLFVRAPPQGRALLFRVLKPHKIQKDALIGEAQVRQMMGKQRLTLMRSGKPRGTLLVDVSDGVSGVPTGTERSATGGVMLPKAALSHGSANAGTSSTGIERRASAIQGCASCATGILDLLGLVNRNERLLAAKAKDPNYITTPSGLIYRVLRKGPGDVHPRLTSSCDCNYKGQLVNGTVFDASMKHGGPQRFCVGEVVKGWTEALQLMVEGDKFELIIPPHLGYRDQPIRGPDGTVIIPANSVLIFEMELLRIRDNARR